MKERYFTLPEVLTTRYEFDLQHELYQTTREETVEILLQRFHHILTAEIPEKTELSFNESGTQKVDSLALRYYRHLLQAITDVEVIPTTQSDGFLFFVPDDKVAWYKAQYRALSKRLAITLDLHAETPCQTEEWKVKEWKEHEQGILVFPNTRHAMWEEIGRAWRSTQDEREADCALLFFSALEIDSSEKEILTEIIRQNTGKGFPLRRLTRQIPIAITHKNLSYPAREVNIPLILATAKARNQDAKSTLRETTLLCTGQYLSSEGFDHINALAEKQKLVDAAVETLKKRLQPRNEQGYRIRDEGIPGQISVAYGDTMGDITLTFTTNVSPRDRCGDTEISTHHVAFELALKIADTWHAEENRRYKLSLFYIVQKTNSDRKPIGEPVVRRWRIFERNS